MVYSPGFPFILPFHCKNDPLAAHTVKRDTDRAETTAVEAEEGTAVVATATTEGAVIVTATVAGDRDRNGGGGGRRDRDRGDRYGGGGGRGGREFEDHGRHPRHDDDRRRGEFRREDEFGPPRGHRDDGPPRGGGGGGGGDRRGRGKGRDGMGTPERRSPTPDGAAPLSQRKRKASGWDVHAPGYEQYTAMQAKQTGTSWLFAHTASCTNSFFFQVFSTCLALTARRSLPSLALRAFHPRCLFRPSAWNWRQPKSLPPVSPSLHRQHHPRRE